MYAREASTLLHKPAKAMHGYKKRGDWLLPVPRSEALRLPCSQERATLRPHADMYNIPPTTTKRSMYIYIPMGIYCCLAL